MFPVINKEFRGVFTSLFCECITEIFMHRKAIVTQEIFFMLTVIYAGATVGLESTAYTVEEDGRPVNVTVCARVFGEGCPISFAFRLLLERVDGSAGRVHCVVYCEV